MTIPKRGPGRPRKSDEKSVQTYVPLRPEVRRELEELAAADRRDVGPMGAILIEEALAARRKKS